MASRAEITSRYARAYTKASKKDKGLVLDQVVEVTGWSRDNARRRLVAASKTSPGADGRSRNGRGRSGRTSSPTTCCGSSIKIRKAGDEVEAEPGFFEGDTVAFFEGDTVAHCGPSLKGEYARTVNLTDFHTGWVFTRSARNNAHAHILSALKAGVDEIPFEVTGLDFDNGSEFLNHPVVGWAGQQGIYFTRSRPYKKNDQAAVESKNGHLVRKYGFYYHYDTAQERAVLNRLWRLVNDRLNYLTPTKKPTGCGSDRNGCRTRLYDKPQTPFDRLLAANVLSPAQVAELSAYRDRLNPAEIGRQIGDLQAVLLKLAAEKTEQLYLASFPPALPDVRNGVRIRAS